MIEMGSRLRIQIRKTIFTDPEQCSAWERFIADFVIILFLNFVYR